MVWKFFQNCTREFLILALPVFNSLLKSLTRILQVILSAKITIGFCVCPAKDLLIDLAVPAEVISLGTKLFLGRVFSFSEELLIML